ncbi:MAG: YcxB family protein [Ruminococcus sp.]|nr:YcxB family protein [Ruminococcus sp.]
MDSNNSIDYIGAAMSSHEPAVFEATVPIDKGHINNFQKFNYVHKQRGTFIFNTVIGILCMLLGVLAGSVVTMILGVMCIALPFVLFNKSSGDSVKNAYSYGQRDIFRFFGDYFTDRDCYSLSVIPYEIITEAHETAEYFFLYITSGKAFVIPKTCFTLNTPEEMSRMLAARLGERFRRH